MRRTAQQAVMGFSNSSKQRRNSQYLITRGWPHQAHMAHAVVGMELIRKEASGMKEILNT